MRLRGAVDEQGPGPRPVPVGYELREPAVHRLGHGLPPAPLLPAFRHGPIIGGGPRPSARGGGPGQGREGHQGGRRDARAVPAEAERRPGARAGSHRMRRRGAAERGAGPSRTAVYDRTDRARPGAPGRAAQGDRAAARGGRRGTAPRRRRGPAAGGAGCRARAGPRRGRGRAAAVGGPDEAGRLAEGLAEGGGVGEGLRVGRGQQPARPGDRRLGREPQAAPGGAGAGAAGHVPGRRGAGRHEGAQGVAGVVVGGRARPTGPRCGAGCRPPQAPGGPGPSPGRTAGAGGAPRRVLRSAGVRCGLRAGFPHKVGPPCSGPGGRDGGTVRWRRSPPCLRSAGFGPASVPQGSTAATCQRLRPYTAAKGGTS